MVTIGIIAMFAGYVLLALPLGSGTLAFGLYVFRLVGNQYGDRTIQREPASNGR